MLREISLIISLVLKLFSVYFVIVALFTFKKPKPIPHAPAKTRFAVLIAARNEAAVIARTVSTLKKTDYPPELFDIFVVPNNCTDNTEELARNAGAEIISCTGRVSNKGDALHQAVEHMKDRGYDALCVFDADNIVDKDYLSRMNDAFVAGASAAKGKCLCTNPYDSWISGCYAIYFGLFNVFYNQARANLGMSAKMNGTGFAISFKLLEDMGGWNTRTIAEDAEFSAMCAMGGHKVWWVPEAVSYDEQPLTLRQSVIQRTRWCGGIMDVAFKKSSRLFKSMGRKNMLAFDFIIFLMTPFVQALSVIPALFNIISTMFLPYHTAVMAFTILIATALMGMMGSMLLASVIAYMSGLHDRRILKSVLTYGIFMLSWIPISFGCLFRRTNIWHEMPHGVARSAEPLTKTSI